MDSWAPRQWAYAVVLFGLVTGTFGFIINDEQEQTVALYNLAQGSLLIEERPDWIYPKVANLTREYRFPGPEPVGSPLLNTVALPLILVVHVADALSPLGIWAAGAAIGLAWGLLPERLHGPRGKVAALAAFAVLAAGFRTNEPDVDTYAPLIALQLANILALGVGAYFLAAAVRRHAPGPSGAIAIAVALAGPNLFWGTKIKYTMFAMALTSIALWLAGEPPSRRRAMALGAVAAFAIWNNIGPGLVVAGGVGLLLLVEALRQRRRRESWSRLGAGTAAGALALTPWMLGNAIISGNPFIPTKIVLETKNVERAGLGGSDETLLEKIGGLVIDETRWEGPGDLALDILDAWTFGFRVESHALGALSISPLLALAAWTLMRARWWRRADLAAGWVFLFLQVALFSNRAVFQGFGWDARLLAPVVPALALIAAPGIHAVTGWMGRPDARRTFVVAGVAAVLLMATVVLVAVLGGLPYALRERMLVRDLLRIVLGSAVVVALLALGAALIGSLPRRGGVAFGIGLLLAVPLAWAGVVAAATPSGLPTDDGDAAVGYVPLLDHGWEAIAPHLFPSYPLPTVIVDNVTVFMPGYGNCQAIPNPCPTGPTP